MQKTETQPNIPTEEDESQNSVPESEITLKPIPGENQSKSGDADSNAKKSIKTKHVKRKRGAPEGNLNALKHGFYSRNFTLEENQDLDEGIATTVIDEIQLVRTFMRRVIASSEDDSTSHQELVDTFRAVCLGNLTLTRLLKLQMQPEMVNNFKDSMRPVLPMFMNSSYSPQINKMEDKANEKLAPELPDLRTKKILGLLEQYVEKIKTSQNS